jgi:hypothetical protein
MRPLKRRHARPTFESYAHDHVDRQERLNALHPRTELVARLSPDVPPALGKQFAKRAWGGSR